MKIYIVNVPRFVEKELVNALKGRFAVGQAAHVLVVRNSGGDMTRHADPSFG